MTEVRTIAMNDTNECALEWISGTYDDSSRGGRGGVRRLRIKAAIVVVCVVDVEASCTDCAACGAKPPLPDLNDTEILSFIAANHLGARICFPDHGSVEALPDTYPVKGWVRAPGVTTEENTLLCPACANAAREALSARRAVRR